MTGCGVRQIALRKQDVLLYLTDRKITAISRNLSVPDSFLFPSGTEIC